MAAAWDAATVDDTLHTAADVDAADHDDRRTRYHRATASHHCLDDHHPPARPSCSARVAPSPASAAATGAAAATASPHATASAAATAAGAASLPTPPPAPAADAGDTEDDSSDDDTSSSTSSDDSSATDSSSGFSAFSVDCERCSRHVDRNASGMRCTNERCRATVCTTCVPHPGGEPDWYCAVHAAARAAAGGAVPRERPATDVPTCVRDLPRIIAGARTRAADHGIAAALQTLGAWREDKDLVELVDDLADTLAFGPASTAAKGRSAVRRFAEFTDTMPQRLATATPSHAIVDIVLAAFVNARCGVARTRPRVWGSALPEPTSVRGEVAAIVGLLRLADLVPHEPRGSLPRMRRALRKCKCCDKHDASPRAYTFMWELEAAWRLSVDRNDPRQCLVWAMCVVAVCFLLRPKYARLCTVGELVIQSTRSAELRWRRDDKGRPVGRPANAPGLTVVPPTGLPAKHPRLTAAAGDMLAIAIDILRRTVPRGAEQPAFPRVETARQTRVVPTGAVRYDWVPPGGGESVPAFWWPATPITGDQWTRNMRVFLLPIVGRNAARLRVPSGLRGGGEMELVHLGTPVAVRATQGWWRAKRLSAEGALITYEGCSTESMCEETSFLGSTYIRVRAPGVYTTTPPVAAWRSARHRAATLEITSTVRSRDGERSRHFARMRIATADPR